MDHKIWVTVTRKPISLAGKENLPAVEVSLLLDELDDTMLSLMIREALTRLDKKNE